MGAGTTIVQRPMHIGYWNEDSLTRPSAPTVYTVVSRIAALVTVNKIDVDTTSFFGRMVAER
jgi:hypothetical protein